MNSEELELSLRTEFESYLKNLLGEMRQEANEFQSKLQLQFDEAFQSFAERFEAEHQFDAAFTGSVAEHLRLARDEGARITADAMAEAEKLDQPAAAAEARYGGIRDAVNDISSKDSQSAILKSLVNHAAAFAPRGAFFIIKSEHFAGWKVFGADSEAGDTIREVNFPTSADTILGAATQSLATVDASGGTYSEDASFTAPLQFGHPDKMYAIPLIARGRSVAVLYADHGDGAGSVNLEALETLVRVAGLTVEMLAATQTAKAEDHSSANFEDAQHDTDDAVSSGAVPEYVETGYDVPAASDNGSTGFAFSDSVSFQGGFPPEAEVTPSYEAAETATMVEDEYAASEEPTVEAEAVAERELASDEFSDEPALTEEHPMFAEVEPEDEVEEVMAADVVEEPETIEASEYHETDVEQPVEEYEPAVAVSGSGYEQVVDPSAASLPPTRLSDRNVDLPIEVPDEERRVHTDARRFARLLVSEIKLYNEKKVLEGREAQDLYDRLKDAIDRSREMYDKRVQPPVAAKFDYFHYELVNSLAEGEAGRLGGSYPGATV